MMSFLKAVVLAAVILAATVANIQAQIIPGLPVNSAQIPVPLGSISPLTENVHLEIPIASIQQRGDDPMIAKFVYDTAYGGVGVSIPVVRNWILQFGPARSGFIDATTTSAPCPDPSYPLGEAYTSTNFYFEDSSLTRHYMSTSLYTYHIDCTDTNRNPDPNTGSPSGGGSSAVDGSGYVVNIGNYGLNESAYDIDGTLVFSIGNLLYPEDSNGNYFSSVGPLKDMFGRTAISPRGNIWAYCSSTNTISYVDVQASDGTINTYTFNCQQYSVSETGHTSFSVWKTSSVVLPNGTSYSFNYDSGTTGNHFGALTSVTLPTGGQEAFSYSCTSNLVWPCDLTSATFEGGTSTFTYVKGGPGMYPMEQATVTGPPRYDSASQQYLNDKTVYTAYYAGNNYYNGQVGSIQYYSGSNALLKTISYTYKGNLNEWPDVITTTLNDTGQSSKVQYQYDPIYWLRDRPTQIQGWDYGSSTPTRTTKMSYGSHNKPTSVTVWTGDGTSGTPLSQTTYTYDEYSASYCKNGVPMLASVTGATNHDDTNFGVNFTNRGNVTSISRWVSGSTWVTSHKCYDTLGNVTQEVDEAGHATNYDYSENWTDTSCIPAGTVTHGYPTTVTDAVGNRRKTKYYTCTGLAQATQDENDIAAGRAGTTYTYDFAGRPLSLSYPDGGQSTYSYSDTSTPAYSTHSTLIKTGSSMSTKTVVDGYGRVTQTQLTSDPEGVDSTDTAYDALGRTASVSNPYRSTTDPTYGITTYAYDALGRTALVGEPDGSTVTTSYSGNTATLTDEAAKKKKSQTDAFGRLTAGWEDPAGKNYETDYTYDVLGNLLCSQQQGAVGTPAGTGCAYAASGDANSPWRIRRFVYDGLSRLSSASNPESGTISYTYNPDGPVLTKTAPLPNQIGTSTVTTTYAYDADHRLTQKAYSDTTPIVKFGFDGVALTGCTTAPPGLSDSNAKGHRTAMCDASGGTSWSHDSMGRILQERRSIGPVIGVYETDVYNLDGSVATQTARGYTVAYTYNGAGRVITAKNNADPFNYVTGATYAPFGGLTGMTMGAKPITVSNSYSNRLQPVVLSASTPAATIMSLSYDFHSATHADNGNVFQIVNNRDSNRTQNFTYDTLNRIQTAYTNGPNWGESFGSQTTPGGVPSTAGIDAWGNLWQRSAITGKTNYEPLNCPASYKNQLTTCSVVPDAAGNVMSYGTANYTYDAENRLIATAGTSYLYDGDGKRVEKCTQGTVPGKCATSATGTLYWTGSGTDPQVESDLAGNVQSTYIFFGDQRIVRRDVAGTSFNVHYYFSDHLGTHALIADANGTMPPQTESDYYPYGGEIQISGSDTNHYKFTGKERDSESGLDYFVARYMGSPLGRFLSVDPENAGSDPSNPQSWNAYAYVVNNPLNLTDPSGERSGCKPGDPGYEDDCPSLPPSDILTSSGQIDDLIVQTLRIHEVVNVVKNWANAPRDPGCMARATSSGIAIGTGTGMVLGGIGGATGGTFALPGGGTLVGGLAGASEGGVIGGPVGGTAGYGLGFIYCSTSSGGGGGGGGGGGKQGKFWKGLKNFRQNIKTNGLNGSARRFFQWDYTHGDVEVYNGQGQHLGSADPESGVMTKPAVPGRSLSL